MPFSSARKWSAVSLPAATSGESSAPAAGVYALGAPTFLRRYLSVDEGAWHAIETIVAEHAAQGLRVLLAAWSEDTDLTDDGDDSVLPGDCRPYAVVILRDVLRPDAAATLERFRSMGVDVEGT